MKAQVFIKKVAIDTRKTKTGKKLTGRIDMQVELPQLEGILDSKYLGTVYTGEVIDYIRSNWRSGRKADGSPAKPISEETKDRRRMRAAILKANQSAVTNIRSPRGRSKMAKMLKALRKQYTLPYTERVEIDGLLTKVRKRRLYMPDPHSTTPLRDSEMLISTLSGRYYGNRRRRAGNARTNALTRIRLKVAGPRAIAAIYEGGLEQRALSRLENRISAFPNTKKLIENAIYWRNMGRAAIAARVLLEAMRMTGRFMRYTAR